MVWSDEFETDGAPDPLKWNTDVWPARVVNDEDQAYTARPKNLRVENGHEKEYVVTVDRPLYREDLADMARGVAILDTVTRPCQILQVNSHVFRIILTQGLNRQIRRMCAAFDYQVRRLTRVRIDNIELGALKSGHWRNLERDELEQLLPGEQF